VLVGRRDADPGTYGSGVSIDSAPMTGGLEDAHRQHVDELVELLMPSAGINSGSNADSNLGAGHGHMQSVVPLDLLPRRNGLLMVSEAESLTPTDARLLSCIRGVLADSGHELGVVLLADFAMPRRRFGSSDDTPT